MINSLLITHSGTISISASTSSSSTSSSTSTLSSKCHRLLLSQLFYKSKCVSSITQLGCARENALTKETKATSFGAFLIDTDKKLRFSMHSSPFVGRNWYELLRQFDCLHLVNMHHVITPSNWCQGQEVVLKKETKPEQAAEYRYVEIKDWFKLTPCPETNK